MLIHGARITFSVSCCCLSATLGTCKTASSSDPASKRCICCIASGCTPIMMEADRMRPFFSRARCASYLLYSKAPACYFQDLNSQQLYSDIEARTDALLLSHMSSVTGAAAHCTVSRDLPHTVYASSYTGYPGEISEYHHTCQTPGALELVLSQY